MAIDYMSLLPPDTVRDLARTSSGYRINRERGAVMLADGFKYWDTYQKAKPWLFLASLVGMGATSIGYMRRRKKSIETQAFWLSGFVASAGGAYFFKPTLGPAAAPDNPYTPQDASGDAGFVVGLDKKIVEYKAKDHNFVDNAYNRFLSLPGIDTAWADTPPMIQALIV